MCGPQSEPQFPPMVAVKIPAVVTAKAGPPLQVRFITPKVGLLMLRVIVSGDMVKVEQLETAVGDPPGGLTVACGTVWVNSMLIA